MSNIRVEEKFLNDALKKIEPKLHEFKADTELVEKVKENLPAQVENEVMREAAKANYFPFDSLGKKHPEVETVIKQGIFFG